MTDNAQNSIAANQITAAKTAMENRLKKRYRSETNFKIFGMTMAGLAITAAVLLMGSIFVQALPSLTESRLLIDYPLEAAKLDPNHTGDKTIIRSQGDFGAIITEQLAKHFPNAAADDGIKTLNHMVSPLATTPMARKVAENPASIGTTIKANFALNDNVDMFLKGGFGKVVNEKISGNINVAPMSGGKFAINGNNSFNAITEQFAKDNIKSDNGNFTLNKKLPSVIIYAGNGAFKAVSVSANTIIADKIITPTEPLAKINQAKFQYITTAEEGRPIEDKMIAYSTMMQSQGLIKQRFNTTLLTHSDSNDPEMAGVLSAVVGSIMTLLITFAITVPVGILAAVYLEEFAPKNTITDIIEVNINNLAAVPSIVFGLLGFSVFLHFFGMPRSAPVVGGIVLALMSLPVIIISARSALKAVPPSIRDAALGLGASKVQAIFHHVLPLAMPGIMTGSILAMAHALGETAPLLMIGMVAFIADLPKSFADAVTVLPVEVYMWAGRPERAWDARTSAAIIVLLLFMIIMNLCAIFLRRKFERRW